MIDSKWRGILVDAAFDDLSFVNALKQFAQKISGIWTIVGIEVEDSLLSDTIKQIQGNMLTDKPFYMHLYRGSELIVVFSDRVFKVTTDRNSWDEILKFGVSRNIPAEQLDFVPNSIEDEGDYFANG